MTTTVSTWEKVTAIATAVGGVGAMLGAIFAYLAARASRGASRDATDALAAAFKPEVVLMIIEDTLGDGTVVARAIVQGPLSPIWPAGIPHAADVEIEFKLASGQCGSSEPVADLAPNGSRYTLDEPQAIVAIRKPDDDWPPPDGDRVTATVSYSDVRRIARYKRSTTVLLKRNAEGALSHQEVEEGEEIRA